MQVHQRAAGKGGKAFQVDGHAGGFAVHPRQQGMRRGAARQFRDQVALGVLGQGRVAAHGAAGVFVQHGQHLLSVFRVVEVDVDDFQHDRFLFVGGGAA